MRLSIESSADPTLTFDLDDVLDTGTGVQSLSGAVGLGLPAIAGQWQEGAGNGAHLRGKRVLARDIDLPLLIQGETPEEFKALCREFFKMLAGECILRAHEGDGSNYSVRVHRVGGGNFTYGTDTTGKKDLVMVLMLRAGDPFFISSFSTTITVKSGTAIPFGEIDIENVGDAEAYPVWHIKGPGSDFTALSENDELLMWEGTLTDGEELIIDTAPGRVVVEDTLGNNRYPDMATAPRFWRIPPGDSTAVISLTGATGASEVRLTWRTRRWTVL